MSAEEILNEREEEALDNNQAVSDERIVSRVKGKNINLKRVGRLKGFTAVGFLVAIVIVIAFFFGTGNFIPSAISERLLESTDVQYADAVESKKLVFQQAMKDGEIPKNTIELLKKNGVDVGRMSGEEFKEGVKEGTEVVLKMNGEIITADNFINKVDANINLYNAFNSATYSRAAYYYDESAHEVFKKIGTNRNNFSAETDFDKVMDDKMGSGSDVNIGGAALISGSDGDYLEELGVANSQSKAESFIENVRKNNPAASANESALNAADSLKVADTISKEQRSSLFFALIVENVSQMKYGDGNDSKLNEAMNFLYDDVESEVVDVNTGELVKVKGSAMDSPSLYAVLSGETMNPKEAENYSSERILKTVENKINDTNGKSAIKGTVASTDTKTKGSIGRFIKNGIETASQAILNLVSPTVSSSLVDNSYDSLKGVAAGEFMVEGAVNLGKMLAKTSGATAGDADTVKEYARLNAKVVAMDSELDRMNRSPFDVTSKNTFLGSIMFNLAVSMRGSRSGLFAKTTSVFGVVSRAIASITPGAYADDGEGYMTTFGECETYQTIGAVGTAQCSEVATFDASTLKDTFNDPGFKAFVEENTTLSGGTRTINNDSVLADFIKNNDERITPLGVMDGGILDSLHGGSSIPFISDILSLIESFLGASEEDKRIATGEAYVNSSSNGDWDKYKYAQRYVSLARATSALRQFSGDSTAYSNIKYFEGYDNPVVAFTRQYYASLDK